MGLNQYSAMLTRAEKDKDANSRFDQFVRLTRRIKYEEGEGLGAGRATVKIGKGRLAS